MYTFNIRAVHCPDHIAGLYTVLIILQMMPISDHIADDAYYVGTKVHASTPAVFYCRCLDLHACVCLSQSHLIEAPRDLAQDRLQLGGCDIQLIEPKSSV